MMKAAIQSERLPTSMVLTFDEKIVDTLWYEAIKNETTNVGSAFKVVQEVAGAPPGWHKVTGHLIFDVKMDFTRKERWVLDGHKTLDPIGISTYADVV